MKKTAIKISGIVTLIFSIVLLAIAIFLIGEVLKIDSITNITKNIKEAEPFIKFFYVMFITIPSQLINLLVEAPADTLASLFASLLVTFSVVMFFWGIKEITFAKRTDEDFALTKKRTGFMYFLKFMFFFYFIVMIGLSFVVDVVKTNATTVDDLFFTKLNFNNGFLIFNIVIAIISLILFILPVANFGKVARKIKADNNDEINATMTQNGGQTLNPQLNSNSAIPQGAMQANMPPVAGYRPMPQPQVQPTATQQVNPQPQQTVAQPKVTSQPQVQNVQPQVNPTQNVQPQQNINVNPQPQVQNAQPSQPNGAVPQGAGEAGANDKLQADLARIDRLKAMGAITEENYQAMKNKIMQGNN